jgi:hypothetical protein
VTPDGLVARKLAPGIDFDVLQQRTGARLIDGATRTPAGTA